MWEASLDPYFGLDWTRNLAAAANTVLRSPAFAETREFEVRRAPFYKLLVRGGSSTYGVGSASYQSYPDFLLDSGFDVKGLQGLLYTLALDQPGTIYLASVNAEQGAPTTADNLRGLPRMRKHYHVAVLVPYFNEHGNFQVLVFESAEETSFSAFVSRYATGGNCVNLVGIPVEARFQGNF
jgi:hypothetical protein